jgi:hypothetical protein
LFYVHDDNVFELVLLCKFEGGTTPLQIAVMSNVEMLQSLSGEIIQSSGTLKIKRSRFYDEHTITR